MCYLGGRKREDALDDLPTSEFLNFGQSTHSIKVLKLRISKTIAHQQDAFSSHPKTFSSLQLRHPGPLFRLAVIGTQVAWIVKMFFLFFFFNFYRWSSLQASPWLTFYPRTFATGKAMKNKQMFMT